MAFASLALDGDTVYFFTLKGQQESPAIVVEDVSRPGVDGVAIRQREFRAEPFDMVGMLDYPDMTTALADYELLRSFRGCLVTLVDDYGVTTNNVVVHEVTRESLRPVVTSTGGVSPTTTRGGTPGPAKVFMTVRLKLQQTGTG
ncbi:MAG TPA: hypothetical protein VH370_08035 [Humisphaera sp.]|jgi:hypothetical protein|nr:hypothetical protein [Humisphaera sp.]